MSSTDCNSKFMQLMQIINNPFCKCELAKIEKEERERFFKLKDRCTKLQTYHKSDC